MTLKLGQEGVYSVLYRFIDKSPRSDIRLFKYDPGKATSPPVYERAKEKTADNKLSALRVLEQERNIKFAKS